jgi:NitT/TauT family transport system permease protein
LSSSKPQASTAAAGVSGGPAASAMGHMLGALAPNRVISSNTLRIIVVFQVAVLLLVWAILSSPDTLLPTPKAVWEAFNNLWNHEGLGSELITSFLLNAQAMVWATLISLVLAYLTVVPFFRPIVLAISKGRFLSMAGITFFFTVIFKSHLKVSMLVFGVGVFFATSMIDVVAQVPKSKFDLARTLRMGEWRVVWEVIVLGRADAAFDMLRQNAAIGWMMLTMVEGISRSQGGIGTLLLNQNKHFLLDAVFAIQICILIVGLLQDYAIGLAKKFICPYADLQLERR